MWQQFGPGMAELAACLNDVLPPHYRDDVAKRAQPYIDQGVPEDLALRVAGLVNLFSRLRHRAPRRTGAS